MFDWLKGFNENSMGHLVLSLFIFILFYIISSKILVYLVNVVSKKVNSNGLHWKLLKQGIKIILGVVCLLGIVDSIPQLSKVSTTLVACSSVIVAAIGLASQDALGNAIDGVFISLFKPFAVGDRIRLINKNITGTVEDINLRYTSVKTVENNLLMIPNSIMNDEIIENSNIIDTRIKAFLDVIISYDSDLQKAKEILRNLVLQHPLFLDIRLENEKEMDAIPIQVRDISLNGVDLRVSVWSRNINDSFQLCSDLRERLLEEFCMNNIKIPYQTIEIIKNG